MAESPPHKFGQIVGNLLESIMQPELQRFCDERGLYLDAGGKRAGVRKGRKVTWQDKYGNKHDLDFVIEKGGTENERGRPVAFIEVAWRRYTKHSRNKAQEIQAAILPIADKHEWDKPFLGVALAGVFTEGSLKQLESVDFQVLYFPYENVVEAFDNVGINAEFDESTPDEEFSACIRHIESLSETDFNSLKSFLVTRREDIFKEFFAKLERTLNRTLDKIMVIPLYGDMREFQSPADAINFIRNFNQSEQSGGFRKYEIIAHYSNGDKIDGSFASKEDAENFIGYLGMGTTLHPD